MAQLLTDHVCFEKKNLFRDSRDALRILEGFSVATFDQSEASFAAFARIPESVRASLRRWVQEAGILGMLERFSIAYEQPLGDGNGGRVELSEESQNRAGHPTDGNNKRNPGRDSRDAARMLERRDLWKSRNDNTPTALSAKSPKFRREKRRNKKKERNKEPQQLLPSFQPGFFTSFFSFFGKKTLAATTEMRQLLLLLLLLLFVIKRAIKTTRVVVSWNRFFLNSLIFFLPKKEFGTAGHASPAPISFLEMFLSLKKKTPKKNKQIKNEPTVVGCLPTRPSINFIIVCVQFNLMDVSFFFCERPFFLSIFLLFTRQERGWGGLSNKFFISAEKIQDIPRMNRGRVRFKKKQKTNYRENKKTNKQMNGDREEQERGGAAAIVRVESKRNNKKSTKEPKNIKTICLKN